MRKPATPLPWASAESLSELVSVDSLGVTDFARPMAIFGKSADAEFVLDAVEMLETIVQQIEDLHKAFGAPGDYGYNTDEGQALYALYRTEISIRGALARPAAEERS